MSRPRKTLLVIVLVIASILGGLFVLTLTTATLYRVPSSAMEPTLHCADPGSGCEADAMDRVVASRVHYLLRDPHRGDIVAFKIPDRGALNCGGPVGGTWLKRIVGLPGERWSEQDGFVYIDGKPLDEPYVEPDRRPTGETFAERTIPKGEYLLLGDNRSQSCDSRRWGYVPRDSIVGPVIAVYWPLDRFSIR